MQPEAITTGESSVAWQQMRGIIAESNYPWRDEALRIMSIGSDTSTVANNRRMNRLRRLDGGNAWRALRNDVFPALRNAFMVTVIVTVSEPEPTPEPTPEPEEAPEEEDYNSYKSYNSYNSYSAENSIAQVRFALRSNLLYDLALVPNLGAEINFGNSWSVIASGMCAWWSRESSHRYWRIAGGELDIRRYFGNAGRNPLSGHHLGLYGQMLKYDVEFGGKGYQSDFSYGAGVEYGYSLPVGRRINIDFSLGLGFFAGRYKTYTPQDEHYVWQTTRNRRWLGPTRVGISLVWLIGRGNTNRKGGQL